MQVTSVALFGLLASMWSIQGTDTDHTSLPCYCNGRPGRCVVDALGLRCLQCRGNTTGRRCERCRDGFYQQGATGSCRPCRCSPAGSVGSTCDSRGRCRCTDGATGKRCDHGASTGGGRGFLGDEPQLRPASCFCFGHASSCSVAPGYEVHAVSSTFTDGVEGWRVSPPQGVPPSEFQFRWSPKHQDVEVESSNILPSYLHAPDRYLGNQLLSYGQTLSFSLRLDRGVRHPSTSDVVLEGAGLRVSAALGDLRSIIPSGQKINYSFRLDERTSSRWRPHLSAFQFQTILSNITTLKIRATFGENGRGYLDNVTLLSARPGDGLQATWVQRCHCPLGHQGVSCERCSPGFRASSPGRGGFSPCKACDPHTGDCLSADETSPSQTCLPGYHGDPSQPTSCLKCPCPDGISCSLVPGSDRVVCDRCPPGTTGRRCDVCQDGFHGDPLGKLGPRTPCGPCQCNGHVVRGDSPQCDPRSGDCLSCSNNTAGRRCEHCLDGFYRQRATDACKPCGCSATGSVSPQCSSAGRCSCRTGFEGPRCQRSSCPPCFSTVQTQVERYTTKLQQLESLLMESEGGAGPASSTQMEKALSATQRLVSELQQSAERLTEVEQGLQRRLVTVSEQQLLDVPDVQRLEEALQRTRRLQLGYGGGASDVQALMNDMKRKLRDANRKLQGANLPLADEAPGPDLLSSLVHKASELAGRHQKEAKSVERSANDALSDSQRSLASLRTLMNQENKLKEALGDLKNLYDVALGRVEVVEKQAARLSSEAEDESLMADSMLKQIRAMELDVPHALKVEEMESRLAALKKGVAQGVLGYQHLEQDVKDNQASIWGDLQRGKAAQQGYDVLLARVNAAEADTKSALKEITHNVGGVDAALSKLRGFDQQIEQGRDSGEAAIQKLPAINSIIQEAVRSNNQTLSVLGSMSGDFEAGVGAASRLEHLVSGLESLVGSLPSQAGLLGNATKLRLELGNAGDQAAAMQDQLDAALASASKQQQDAEQAAKDANASHAKAKRSRQDVRETLERVNDLLSVIGQPGAVDEQQLTELESSLADARDHVNQTLKPRLQDMEDKEEGQRLLLARLNGDIDSILDDITNLEDILQSVPKGCYKSLPNELP